MRLIVQKYGGSSLASPRHIQDVAKRIARVKQEGWDIVVVVSAMGRMTDALIRLAHRTVAKPAQRELDMLMTAGERISMSLLAMSLEELGISAISFTGSQSGIQTTSDHCDARIVAVKPERIKKELEKGRVVIIAGFQGVSAEKEITTLGRGGSDTTAVALAAALNAEHCEILSDVEGHYSADPRIVEQATLIEKTGYAEALELSRFGAKMPARSIEVASRFGVKIRMAHSRKEDSMGTWILEESKTGFSCEQHLKGMEDPELRGVASKGSQVLYQIPSSSSSWTDVFSKLSIPLTFSSFSSQGLILVCEASRAELLERELEASEINFSKKDQLAVVAAVGEGLGTHGPSLAKFVQCLNDLNIEILGLASTALSLSAAISEISRKPATIALHQAFHFPTTRPK